MNSKLNIIIAGSYRQYLSFLLENKIKRTDPNYRYVCQKDELRGLRAYQVNIVKYGTWWNNECADSDELIELESKHNKKSCICVDFLNGNPDPVPNSDCPIHGAGFIPIQ